ncbi:MAG: hypothetical protein GXP52_07185 [Deltaproteobacteria bacterium]|nr:hypothetical protein [Deltaproteobacteria bacterium]
MKNVGRKDDYILQELLNLAFRLDIRIRREALGDDEAPAKSGLVYLEGKPVLFLDRRLSASASVEVLVHELAPFPLDGVYVKPAIRELMEHRTSGGREHTE